MPGANTRALEKAATLDCDALIFDLEDAVAPSAKAAARDNVVAALKNNDYAHRELVVRVNGLDTPWGADDVSAVAALPLNAVLFPKVDSAAMVVDAAEALVATAAVASVTPPPVWAMIESPASLLKLEQICSAHGALEVLVMGTSDLVRDLRARHVESREPLLFALSAAVTAARAFDLDILDGVHLDFRNLESFRTTCEQGRGLGFDGRTLIHPSQVDIANEIYGFSAEDLALAERIIEVWERAEAKGLGVVELDGQLIENLHAAEARRTLAFAKELRERR